MSMHFGSNTLLPAQPYGGKGGIEVGGMGGRACDAKLYGCVDYLRICGYTDRFL